MMNKDNEDRKHPTANKESDKPPHSEKMTQHQVFACNMESNHESGTMIEYPSHNELFCWGGLSKARSEKGPVHVQALKGIGIKQICSETWELQANAKGYVLTESNELYQWGPKKYNELYQWGPKKMFKESHSMRGITGKPLIKEPILQIACGEYHTAAVSLSGNVYTWGGVSRGQLGHGECKDVAEPKQVEGLVGIPIKQVACGYLFTISLSQEQEVFSWGTNEGGCTGRGTDQGSTWGPQKIQAFTEPIGQISASWHSAAAVSTSGKLFTWGKGEHGRLGHGNEDNCLVPTLVTGLAEKQVSQVSFGRFHTAVVTEDGSLCTFGSGGFGKLGHGDTENRLVPTLVQGLEKEHVVQVSCGMCHIAAVTLDGEVYTWGKHKEGQLGYKSEENAPTPQLVDDLCGYKVSGISSFESHTVALVDSSSFPLEVIDRHFLLNDPSSSDVVFKVEGEAQPIYAHSMILTARSEFFRSFLHWKSPQNEMTMTGASKTILLIVLQHIYGQTLDLNLLTLEQLFELYGLSDMYQLLHLKRKTLQAFRASLTTQNVLNCFMSLAGSGFHKLHSVCVVFIEENIADVLKEPGSKEILKEHFLLTVDNAVLLLKKAETRESNMMQHLCLEYLSEHPLTIPNALTCLSKGANPRFERFHGICTVFVEENIVEVLKHPSSKDILLKHYLTVERAILLLEKAVASDPIETELQNLCVEYLTEHGCDVLMKMDMMLERLGRGLAVDICNKAGAKMKQNT